MVLLYEERQKVGIGGEVVGLGMLCWSRREGCCEDKE